MTGDGFEHRCAHADDAERHTRNAVALARFTNPWRLPRWRPGRAGEIAAYRRRRVMAARTVPVPAVIPRPRPAPDTPAGRLESDRRAALARAARLWPLRRNP